MIDQINLKDKTLAHFGRKQFRSTGKGTLWPSEASVKYTDIYNEEKVIGKCHRAVHYRLNKVVPTNPPSPKTQILFLLGNAVETMVTEAWKQMGLWENNSVKWEDRSKNLSGEFDVILKETDIGEFFYGVEVKSFFGYFANKQILGHWSGRGKAKQWNPGHPKDEHLMQAALYVDHSEGRLAGFKLFYVSRDQTDMAEFNVIVDPTTKEIFVNGIKETRFTVNDIYARYETLNTFKNQEIKPQREFVLEPSDERVKVLHDRGEVSATAFKDHFSGKKKCNDWHCSYCDFKDHCWTVDIDAAPTGAGGTDCGVTQEEAIVVDEMHEHGSL